MSKSIDGKSIKASWQAVSVVPGRGACEGAEALREQRFLARNAPRLPLPNCSKQDQCQCKYERYSDRRSDLRRSDDRFKGKSTAASGQERRRPGERRERR